MIEITSEMMSSATNFNYDIGIIASKKQKLMIKKVLRHEPASMKKPRYLIGRNVEGSWWEKFLLLHPDLEIKKKRVRRKKLKKGGKNWAWKPGSKTDEFYSSREWRTLRVRVLEQYQCKCMMCGESPKVHGIVIHVDHIKPRSNYPELALTFSNLQLLCEACNLGKSNKYDTDWRPGELEIVLEATVTSDWADLSFLCQVFKV